MARRDKHSDPSRSIKLSANATLALTVLVATWVFGGAVQAAPSPPSERRSLHVAIYPFIPEAADAYLKIEQTFEAKHPDIRLEITQNQDYYDPKPGGVSSETADVYELDSVFLEDFVAAGKIQPLPGDWSELNQGLAPMARTAMQIHGVQYGAPHWLCSYFLFFRREDKQLASAHSLKELEALFSGPSPSSWMIAEYAGKSTLGELYLDAVLARTGPVDAALAIVRSGQPEADVVGDMARSVRLIEPGLGRDPSDYHDRIGFYGRTFAHQGRAMVSYSEGVHDTLYETANGCLKGERCLTDDDLDVIPWPDTDAGSREVAWVDLLTIGAAAKGQTLADAETFIRFMEDPSTFKLLLVPTDGGTPRYLLPALQALYADPDVLRHAHLYAKLLPIIEAAQPVTAASLNQDLRALGGKVDALLPRN